MNRIKYLIYWAKWQTRRLRWTKRQKYDPGQLHELMSVAITKYSARIKDNVAKNNTLMARLKASMKPSVDNFEDRYLP